MALLSPARVAILAGLAAAAALAAALALQRFAGLIPCPLCLIERWPYRIAIALAAATAIAPRRWQRAGLALIALTFFADAAVAAVHIGVEQHWWPSPLPECNASPLLTALGGGLAQLPARPSRSCADPTYLIPALPVSMAMMNLFYALAGTALIALYLGRGRR